MIFEIKKYINKITRILLFTVLLILSVILITQAEEYTDLPLKFSEELIFKEREIEIAKQNINLTEELQFTQTGISSFYGKKFHARKTSSGELFLTNKYTAAHRTLPFGSIVKVTNNINNKSTLVIINDRGPFIRNRIIDISPIAAGQIDSYGIPPVTIQTIIRNSELLTKTNDTYFAFSLNLEPLVLTIENLNILQVYDNFTTAVEILNELQNRHPYIDYSIVVTSQDYYNNYPKEKRSYYLAIITPKTLLTMNL